MVIGLLCKGLENKNVFCVLLILISWLSSTKQQRIHFFRSRESKNFLDSDHLDFLVSSQNTKSTKLIVSVFIHGGNIDSEVLLRKVLPSKHAQRKIFFRIKLPQRIVYFESRKLGNPTDFFRKKLVLLVCSVGRYKDNTYSKYKMCLSSQLPLLPPFSRMESPNYSLGWELWLKKQMFIKQFHICPKLNDVVNLIPYPVASSGDSEMGFVRKLDPLSWPEHVSLSVRKKFTAATRFTIISKIFLLEWCKKDICNIISHRSTETFLSPTILLNRKGHLHFQLHEKDGSGGAFLTSSPVPLRKWINFTFALEGNQAHLIVEYDETKKIRWNLQHTFKAVWYKSDVGFWSIGGYPGLDGFHGMICCTTLYRNHALVPQQIYYPHWSKGDEVMKAFAAQHKKCIAVKLLYHRILRNIEKHNSNCSCKKPSFSIVQKQQCSNLHILKEKLTTLQILPKNQTAILKNVIQNGNCTEIYRSKSVSRKIHNMAMSSSLPAVKEHSLELAGCLGNMDSFFISSVLFLHGMGFNSSALKAVQRMLYAAAYGNPLAQLSVGYKHQIGFLMQKSPYLAAGYYRGAAVTARKIMEKEDRSISTQSEMIRLDEYHTALENRGLYSGLMNWLKIQAKFGSSIAQRRLAEINFHGEHGVDANREDAVALFREGAAQQDASALYNLGVLHLKGVEVPKNETLAMNLFEAAAKKNFTMAYGSMGYYELISRNNISGAIHYWKIAADLGDRDGTFNLASQYETGVPGIISKDKVYALELFQKSANKGQLAACIKIADNLINGDILNKNIENAIRYYRFVADHLPGTGVFLRKGFDSYIGGNIMEALSNYVFASETGLALAFFNGALICEENPNISLLQNCTLKMHSMAAELGWTPSILYIGDLNWYGGELPLNKRQAALKYAAALEHVESPRALFNLGYIIENSIPIPNLKLNGEKKSEIWSGNKNLAASLYTRCQVSVEENMDGYYPCGLALMKMKLQSYFTNFFSDMLPKIFLSWY